METATFIKAYFIYKFCNIRNGDFFRSQADNLTKFGQTILSDKIINPSGLFDPDQDKNKKGNTNWIEYIYFKLYFTKNPNKPVENIKFSFQTPTTTNGGGCGYNGVVSEHNGGSKIKRCTKKNIKAKNYTRRNNGKKNKKTIHKYQNKKNKKTIRQRGGDIESDQKKLKEKLNVNENIPQKQEEMKQKQLIIERQKVNKQLGSEIQEKLAQDEERKIKGEDEATQNRVGKDLVFDIVGIDFSAFRDTQEITETIVRNKTIDNEINKKEAANEKLKTIFVTFMKKYDEYLTVFSNDTEMTPKQRKDLPIFVYTYLLLGCYNTAFRESRVPLGKFNNDSWWFFTAGDFKIIANYLDIEIIIDNFNKLIGEIPEVTTEVEGEKPTASATAEVEEAVKEEEPASDETKEKETASDETKENTSGESKGEDESKGVDETKTA